MNDVRVVKTGSFKYLTAVLLFIILAAGVFFSERSFDRQSIYFHTRHGYIVPDARAVKLACLGFDNLASDVFAFKALNSLFVSDRSDPNYWKHLVHAFRGFLKNPGFHSHGEMGDVVSFARYAYIATYLDPYDVDRIEMFTLLMSWLLDFPDGTIPILEYASSVNVRDWRLPYYLALNYLIFKGDKEKALRWLEASSQRPGTLRIVKSLMIDIALEGKDRETAIGALSDLKNFVGDKEIKKDLEEKINILKHGGKIKSVDWTEVRKKIEKDIEISRHHHHEHDGNAHRHKDE
jgi:hypothetical protein